MVAERLGPGFEKAGIKLVPIGCHRRARCYKRVAAFRPSFRANHFRPSYTEMSAVASALIYPRRHQFGMVGKPRDRGEFL